MSLCSVHLAFSDWLRYRRGIFRGMIIGRSWNRSNHYLGFSLANQKLSEAERQMFREISVIFKTRNKLETIDALNLDLMAFYVIVHSVVLMLTFPSGE